LSAFGTGFHAEGAARFLPNLTLAWTYTRFGAEPFAYHLTNLVAHLITVVLVALFGRSLLRRVGGGEDGIALFGAGLFALHPLNTEAVNYCNARPNVMVTLFYVAALVAGLHVTEATNVSRRGRRVLVGWTVFGACALAALLCKELAVTLVAVAPLTFVWFAREGAVGTIGRRALSVAAGALVVAGTAVGFATGAWRGAWDQVVHTGAAVTGHWLSYAVVTVLGQSEVFLRYLGLALVPWPGFLNVDHRALEHLHERLFEQGRVVDGAVGVLAIPLASFAIVLVLLRLIFAWRARAAVGAYCALWPFLTHAPTSLVPRGEVMVEYRTYLPMVGICVGLAWGLSRAYAGWGARRMKTLPPRLGSGAVVALLAVLTAGTVTRNRAWTTQESMWRASIAQAPDNARAYNGLGMAARAAGDLEAALAHFRRAVEIDPDYAESQNNLGALLAQRGELDAAGRHLSAAVRRAPDHADAYNNLGNVLVKLGRPDDAVVSYRKALELKSRFPEAEMNLGMTLARLGDVDGALAHYQRAVLLMPDNAIVHMLVGRALVAKGRVDDALGSLRHAVSLAPNDADARTELGKVLSYRADYAGAARELERALAIDPTHREARSYLDALRRPDR
jgi:Flp pilus assembly protein TadD